MPRTYSNPYDVLAQNIGGGLARLFGPRDNTQAMKYMLGASQIGENRANIGKLDSETGLNTQEQGFRAQLGDPAALQQVMPDAAPGLAQLFSAALGLSTGGDDGVTAINRAIGGDQMMRATNEGDMRAGYALTGHDANVNNAMTQSGITDLFGQQTDLNDADNATAIQRQNIAAAASRYGSDQSAAASRYGANLHYGVGGASDRAAREVSSRAAQRKPGAAGEITPGETAQFTAEIARSFPPNAQVDGKAMARAGAMAAARARETGDSAGAISEVAQLFQFTDGPLGVDNKGRPLQYKIGVLHAPRAAAVPVTPAVVAPVLDAATQALIDKYSTGQ
jgi:hypothetical protein